MAHKILRGHTNILRRHTHILNDCHMHIKCYLLHTPAHLLFLVTPFLVNPLNFRWDESSKEPNDQGVKRSPYQEYKRQKRCQESSGHQGPSSEVTNPPGRTSVICPPRAPSSERAPKPAKVSEKSPKPAQVAQEEDNMNAELLSISALMDRQVPVFALFQHWH